MSIAAPTVIQSANLSIAWGRAFLDAFKVTDRTRAPLVLSVGGFPGILPEEDAEIRSSVDQGLAQLHKSSAAVSGMTIFPYDLWRHRGRPACEAFAKLCVERFLPRLKACDARNRLGTYFERLMNFRGAQHDATRTVNQLLFIISLLKNGKKWPRHSALQMSCFDPAKDHTGQPVRGFPCLQQVGISHDGEGKIAVHAFYPSQYIFDRGYGNYLGLCHLGAFIAHETGLRFARLNCYVGQPHLGDVNKRDVSGLVKLVQNRIAVLSEGG